MSYGGLLRSKVNFAFNINLTEKRDCARCSLSTHFILKVLTGSFIVFTLPCLTLIFPYTPWSPKQHNKVGETWRAERRPKDAPRLPPLRSAWRPCSLRGRRSRRAGTETRSSFACGSVFRVGYRSMNSCCCGCRGCWSGRGRCTASLSPWHWTHYSGKRRVCV